MSTNNLANKNTEQSFKVEQNVQILEQYVLQKGLIIEKLKNTYLFPYLLNMQYMIGNIGSIKVTEDPIEELGPHLNTLEGINKTMEVSFTREELADWEIFKYNIYLFQDEQFINTEELSIYLLLKLTGNSVNLMIFGIINNNIIKTDKCLEVLNNDVKIRDTKIELGLI